ncbi:hypothetical protein FGO68_gene1096 [Halteria grandinella]|uniref:Uncharacterized protein n=1 Tax=Halteria grandinella TaxID=5974 RepID=A0A8J8NI35_HALGN|nr:hypothetical protein FGO68_gene1096 [Halteria grandinella]
MLLPILDKLKEHKIVLASASVNRKNILEKANLTFEISPSTFEENLPHSDFPTTSDYVVKTSEMKLVHKLQEYNEKSLDASIFIVADTIISLNDSEILEKPQDKEHAFMMLRRISDAGSHEVMTSVWIAFAKRNVESGMLEVTQKKNILDKTRVHFLPLSDEVIKAYVESGEPFGKAGGYGIQGIAGTFIHKIEGCYYSVWGFPLASFCRELTDMINQQ